MTEKELEEKQAQERERRHDLISKLMTFVNEWMPDFKIDLVKLYSLTTEEFDKEFRSMEKSVIAEVDKIKTENLKLKKEAEDKLNEEHHFDSIEQDEYGSYGTSFEN